ncbi:uncharacterized protein EV420DRAFT_1549810 [Desarmillaria tabescens]|uniref:F-box domain-containing protein n=1 Tax=Armillaria tabescens TaxID=1929756 RepID=A0AA39K9W1_ARMTA|nr:uncharacterized protein EV420DRAFT_1549810 [Desarmillaria tabescens]KAK0457266.1 hypothetical protein EV420DRAFT_1549810 [Desarmillaria tabescens]
MITTRPPTCPCPQCGFASSEKPLPNGISPARLQVFFDCNDAPVGAERAELEAVVCEGEHYLALLQQRISQTRDTLESLLEEQKRAVKHISDSKLVLNPVRRLPSEILSHIFLSCILPDSELLRSSDGEEDASLLDSLNITDSPWNVSYVSSQWRHAALATAKLWSFIRLQLHRYKSHAASLFRLGTYLERSGTQQLTVAIESEEDMSDHPILPVILSASPRWKKLFVGLPFSAFRIFNNISGSLSALTWLGIYMDSEPDTGTEPISMIEAFRFAPQLQELKIVEWDWGTNFHDLFHLPWEHITEASTQGNNMQALAVLQRAPNLVSALFSADVDFLSDTPSELCWHAHLQVLDVTTGTGSSPEFIVELFERLALPGLLELRIALSGTEEEIVLPEFTSETAPILEDLCIQIDDSNTLDSETLACLLKHTPLLTDLKVSARVTTDNVFLQLGRKRDISRLVPLLRSIDLTGSTFEFEDASNIIIGMVASRTEPAEGCVSLQTLILDEPFFFEDDDLSARWERLGQDGLDIQYSG